MNLLALMLAGILITATVTVAQDSQVYQPGDGVSTPKVIKRVMPSLTAAALRAKLQGTVLLAAVVREDGTVGDVKVTRSSFDAKYSMDDEAVRAAKQWTFSPGMKDGKPVAVTVSIELAFNCDTQAPAHGPLDYSKPGFAVRMAARAPACRPFSF